MTSPTLTWIGTGSAFNGKDGNTASILRFGDVVALLDCGFSVPNELKRLGLIDEITHVFISHTHSDHAGGLELLAQWRYFVSLQKGIKVPTLVVPPDILERLRLNEKLGLGNIQDAHGRPLTATLETYFDVEPLPGWAFEIKGPESDLDILYEQVEHVPGGDFPSYGWLLREFAKERSSREPYVSRKKLFETIITSDTRVPYESLEYVNLAFHDCQLFEGPHCGAGDVHANINQLMVLSDEVKAKIRLVHYGENWEQFQDQVREAGLSFVRPGQTFKLG